MNTSTAVPHVVDVRFTHSLAEPLIVAQVAEIARRYGGGGDASPIDPDQFFPPRGAFFVAVVDDEPVGCAGLRRLAAEDSIGKHPAAEIKRMYVAEGFRRRGIAQHLLHIVALRAHAMNCDWLLLESGVKQPEALALYERYGFERVSGFGHYAGYDDQVGMALDLGTLGAQRR